MHIFANFRGTEFTGIRIEARNSIFLKKTALRVIKGLNPVAFNSVSRRDSIATEIFLSIVLNIYPRERFLMIRKSNRK